MTEAHLILSFARIATAALAGTIGIFAARAYHRTRRRDLLALALGAGILAAGYLSEGILVELLGWSVQDATILESITTLAAVGILVASLYVRDAGAPRIRSTTPSEGSP